MPNYRTLAKYLVWKADDWHKALEADKMVLSFYLVYLWTQSRPLTCIMNTSIERWVGCIIVDPGTGLLDSDLSLLLIVASQPVSTTYSPPYRQNNNSVSYLTGVLGVWIRACYQCEHGTHQGPEVRPHHYMSQRETGERIERRERGGGDTYLLGVDLA